MGRIPGHYEWDDDSLVPGHKKEGGLHQNLFDRDGKLAGSARFVPADDDEPLIVTETVYVPIEQRRGLWEDEEFQKAVAALAVLLITDGKPLAERWWRETARPAIDAQRLALQARRDRRSEKRRNKAKKKAKAKKKEIAVSPVETTVESRAAIEGSPIENRQPMSSAEARARYLAALAAQAYSEEQLRILATSRIVDADGLDELQRSFRDLPAELIRELIEAMAKNPALLRDETLADLASILSPPNLEGLKALHMATHEKT